MLYLPREEGQGLVEYALILVLVAIVVTQPPVVQWASSHGQGWPVGCGK